MGVNAGAGMQIAAFLSHLRATPLPFAPLTPAAGHGKAADILGGLFRLDDEAHRFDGAIPWDAPPGTFHYGHDLNRFVWLHPLARAAEGGDRAAARQATRLILRWIADEPPGGPRPGGPGYRWRYPIDVAIRLENWALALARILPACPDALDAEELATIRASAAQHAELAGRMLDARGVLDNWTMLVSRGLLIGLAGFALDQDEAAIAAIRRRIEDFVRVAVMPDGVTWELTTHYHWVCLACLAACLERLTALGTANLEPLRDALGGMLHFGRQMLAPDGRLVALGDGDPALGMMARQWLDDPVLRRQSSAEGFRPLASAVFAHAGIGVLRGGQACAPHLLTLDGGPFGFAHQHDDALSISLAAFGRRFLVDPGRHRYGDDSACFLPYLRSTRAHSTIRIDDQDQARRLLPRGMHLHTGLPPLELGRRGDAEWIEAGYADGYGPARIPVRHWRRVETAGPAAWTVEDRLEGDGEHLVESRLQFAPGSLRLEAGRAVTGHADANLSVLFDSAAWDDVRIECGEKEPRAGWYSDILNHVEPAPALVFRRLVRLPWRCSLRLMAWQGAEG